MPYSAGTAILDVVPVFRGVQEAIGREIRKMESALGKESGEKFGEEFGKSAEKAVDKALNTSVRKAATKSAGEAADDFAGEFQSQLRRSMARAQRQLGSLKVDAEFDDRSVRNQVRALQKNLERLGKVEIGSDMDAGPALIAISRIEKKLEDVQDAASSLNARVAYGEAIKDLREFREKVRRTGNIEVEVEIKPDRALGAFERVFKARMKTILDAIPPVKLEADSSDVAQKIAAVRAELLALTDAKIGIELSGSDAIARAAAVKEVIESIGGDRTVDLGLAFDTKAAAAELDTFIEVVKAQVGPVEIDVTPRMEGAATRLIRTRLEEALQDFSVEPDLVTGEIDREAQALRLSLLDLRDLHINGYLDADEVIVKAAEIKTLMTALEHDRVDIDIKTNASSAIASLTKITALSNTVDTSWGERLRQSLLGAGQGGDSAANSFRGFSGIVLGIAAGLPLLVPLLASAGAGLLALGAAGVGAAAGLAVLAFAFGGIKDAVQALGKDQDTAGKTAVANARTMRDASASVEAAELGLSRAREASGQAAQQAARQVSDAIASQQDAEEDLVRAQEDVVRAQEDVNRAREEARDRIEDLRLSLQGGAIAERQAVLDLKEAEHELAAARAAGVGGDELEQLLINRDRELQGLQRIRLENGRMAEDQAEFNRTGIEGSREVVGAQEAVQRAQEGVSAAMDRVASAGVAVKDALQAQQQTQASSAQSIADAQKNLTKAQQSYSDALYDTSTAGSAAGQAVKQAFGKLGPEGQMFALYIHGLRDDMRGLRDVAQKGVLPGVQAAMSAILTKNGPQLTAFLTVMSQAVGDLFRELGDLLTSAQWKAIFADFSRYAPVFMTQFGQVGMNLLTFFGGLFQAFAPMAKDFGDFIVRTSAQLRDWALGLKGSEALKDFLAYVGEVGPRVWALFRDILGTILHIAEGIAPFAGVLLSALDGIFSFLAALDPQVIGAITTAILGLTVAFQVAHGAITLFSQGADLWVHPLSRIIFVVGGIVTAFGALYTTSQSFRDFVDWVVDRVEDLVGVFTGLPGPIQAALTAMGGFALLRGPLSGVVTGIRDMFQTMALKVLYAKDAAVGLGGQLKGLGSAGGAASVAKRGLGGISSFLGGPWGIAIGIAVTGLGFLISSLFETSEATKNAESYQKDLTQALRDSKGAIDDNVRAMAAQKAQDTEFGDFNLLEIARRAGIELPKVTDALLGNRDAAKEVEAALRAYAETQSQVMVDENGITTKIYNASGQAALDAAGSIHTMAGSMAGAQQANKDLAIATGDTTTAQERLDTAASRVNDALAKQQQQMVDMYEASKNFDDSTKDLAKAHEDVAKALEDEGADSDAYTEALSRLEDQAYNTATAAGAVSDARHGEEDDADLHRNAAILENLRQQEAKYGELPPRLADLKASLEEVVPAAYQATAHFEALGLKVVGVPNSKRIIVSSTSDEQIAALEALGIKVKTLPDGTVELTADTDAAQKIIDDFIGTPRRIVIGSTVTWQRGSDAQTGLNADGSWRGSSNAGRAQGGPIYGPGGPTSDSILARLSNGEFVVKAASVQKYGLGFLHAVNAGKYAAGGLVKKILPRFAGGGMAANWGGSISLTGGDTNPLAQVWFEAIRAIDGAASKGGKSISGHFSELARTVLATMADLRGRSASIFSGMTSTLSSLWSGMGSSIRRNTLDTSNYNINVFGGMRTSVTGIITDAITRLKNTWAGLGSLMARPVNFVINSVLNNGLFKAFNSIVGALGLPKEWKIPTAAPVTAKLAAGGRVPGWSPHDTADNIPAMLTADEYVLPVGATRRLRRRLGDGGLEMLRQGILPAYATGGLVKLGRQFQKMGAIVSEHPAFGGVTPGAHVNGSLHYTGHAIDVNTRPGTSALEQRELSPMMNLARSLGFHVIFLAPGHYNHGHVDDGGGASTMGDVTPAWYDLFGSVAGVLKTLTDSVKGKDTLDDTFGGNSLTHVLQAMPDKAVSWIWGKAKDTIGDMFSGVLENLSGTLNYLLPSASSGPIADVVRGVASKYGWGSGGEWAALSALINKESSFNPNAQNPTSTAYGLFQFLNGTWAGTGISKTSNPALQTEAGLRYIRSRYGTPSQALSFHNSHNWYSEGGDVTADGPGAKQELPTLYDTGGWLPPGMTTVLNATGRPEPILTGDQWDRLLQTGVGGDSAIKELHIHEVATNIEEAIGAVNHNLRVLSAGGRYSTRDDDF